MRETIGMRFSKLIEALNSNKSVFAKSIGRSHTVVGMIIDGKSKPGFEVLESVIDNYPSINPNWLLTGEGDMFKGKEQLHKNEYLHEHLQTLEANFARLASQLETKDQLIASLEESRKNLERMLEVVLGKSKGAIYGPLCSDESVYQNRIHGYLLSVFQQPFIQSIFLR